MSKPKPVEDMTLGDCQCELAEVFSREDPFPATLDAIAASMPEGWLWEVCRANQSEAANVVARAWKPHLFANTAIEFADDAEILARAHLAVACWRAKGGVDA